MNKDVYDGLPEDVQTVIDEISGDALVTKFADWWIAWGEAGPGEIIDAGGEVITPDDALRQSWIDAIAATNEKLEAGLADECANGEGLVTKVKELAAN